MPQRGHFERMWPPTGLPIDSAASPGLTGARAMAGSTAGCAKASMAVPDWCNVSAGISSAWAGSLTSDSVTRSGLTSAKAMAGSTARMRQSVDGRT